MLTLEDFIETGALLTGHFRLSSGLHSDRYLQCARLLMWPERAERAGRELAARLAEFSPQAVVSPALGGVVIGHEVARALGVRAMFVERKDGAFALRRGFALEPGEPVVVVEDVFTTGGRRGRSARPCTRRAGRVVAVGSIVDRGLPAGRLRGAGAVAALASGALVAGGGVSALREGRPAGHRRAAVRRG